MREKGRGGGRCVEEGKGKREGGRQAKKRALEETRALATTAHRFLQALFGPAAISIFSFDINREYSRDSSFSHCPLTL